MAERHREADGCFSGQYAVVAEGIVYTKHRKSEILYAVPVLYAAPVEPGRRNDRHVQGDGMMYGKRELRRLLSLYIGADAFYCWCCPYIDLRFPAADEGCRSSGHPSTDTVQNSSP